MTLVFFGGKMGNFKTAHVKFDDVSINFMENKIFILWTDTGCSTNCKKTSIVNLNDIERIRYCVIKDNEYNFIQIKKKTDSEISSLDEAIKSETCFIVKENEEYAVNNMLEYIKKSYEGDDSTSKNEKIINLMKQYEKQLYKKTPNYFFYYGDKLQDRYRMIKKEYGNDVSLDEVIAIYANSAAVDTVFTEKGFYTKIGGSSKPTFFEYSNIVKLCIERFMGQNVCVYLKSNPDQRILITDANIFGFVGEKWVQLLSEIQGICLQKHYKAGIVEYIELDSDSDLEKDDIHDTKSIAEKVIQFENSIEHFPIGIGTVSVKKMECGKYKIRIEHKSGRSYIFETTNNDIETLIARGVGRLNYKEQFDNE